MAQSYDSGGRQSKGAPSHRMPGPHGPGGNFLSPDQRAKSFKGSMGKLLSYMAQYKILFVLVLVFATASCAFGIFGPKVLSEATTVLFNGVVAEISNSGSIDFSRIGAILLTTLAIYLLSALCQWAQGWIMSGISQKSCYRLRQAIIEKIDRIPYSYFEKTSTGDILSRITNDVDTLGQSLNQGITQLITSSITVVGVVVMMLSINWVMTLIALLMIPVSAVLAGVVIRLSQKHFFAQQNLLGQINGQVEETFSGHAVVKAFGREDETVDDFKKVNDSLFASAWKSQFLSGLMMPIMNFVGNLGYVAVAVSGSFFAVLGVITVGDIQAFIQYVKNFTQPISQLAQVSNVFQQLAAAAERIFDFLELPEMPPERNVVEPSASHASVEFDRVCFAYDPDVFVINDFTAFIEEGQTVAIVGPTGSGKTTCVKLLMRFYDVSSGSIRIGGTDIRNLLRGDVRSMFAMVLQDTWLFNGTIRENIRYGRLDATDDEVELAAKRTCAHHFIMTLPGGYDFEINEDASNISQGQRQLLTIARAMLADREMLILDEATSSIDTRTEVRIQEAMDTLMRGRTSFVIAHRLSTIKNADLILVMENGDIVESGTHSELLALDGVYSDLYNSQFEES